MNPRNVLFLVVAALGFASDQASKAWIVANLPANSGRGIVIVPELLELVHAQNPGAAFGILRDFEYRHLLFVGFTVIAVGVILDMLRKLPEQSRYMAVVLGLVLSGAVGNAVDRLRQRWVTDFLQVHLDRPEVLKNTMIQLFGTSSYPAFNLADTWLVVGIVLYVIHELFFTARPPAPAPAEPPPAPAPPAT